MVMKIFRGLLIVLFCAGSGLALYPMKKQAPDRKAAAGPLYKTVLRRGGGYRTLFNAAGKAALQKEYGFAVLLWEQARIIYDGDAASLENIRTVKRKTGASRYEVGVPPLVRFFLFFYFAFSRATLYSMLTFGLVLLFILLNIVIVMRRTDALWFRIATAAIVGSIIVLGGTLAFRNRQVTDPARAVVIQNATPMRQHQAVDSPLLLKLPQGLEVSISSMKDESCRVSLPGGGQGWIPKASVIRINRSR